LASKLIKDKIKKIYFIENDCTINNQSLFKDYDADVNIIVCLNYLPAKRLRESKVKNVFVPTDILSHSDYDDIHNITDTFSNTWFIDDGVDCSMYEGVSGGNLTSIMFDRNFLAGVTVVYTQILKRLLDKYSNIDCIYHDLSINQNYFNYPDEDSRKYFNKKKLFEDACKQLLVSVRYIEPKNPIPSEHIYKDRSILTDLKVYARRLLFIIFGIINRAQSVKNGPSIYLDYSKVTESLLYDYNKSKQLIASTSALNHIFDKSFITLSLINKNNFREEVGHLKKGVNFNVDKMRALIRYKSSQGFFKFHGVDYSYLYTPILHNIIDKIIPNLRVDSRRIRNTINEYSIDSIILNNIRTEKSKNMLCVAKMMGVKTIFVDHGIQGHIHAKKNIHYMHPDIYVSPGNFMNYQLESKFLYLGNPSLDSFGHKRRKKIHNIRKILFLSFGDNFYGRYDRFGKQEKYYEIIFETAKQIQSYDKYTLSYRSHSSNREYNEYIFNFFGVKNLMLYDEKDTFENIIYNYDLVVCNITNCFYQSISAGVPVIFVEPDMITDSINMPYSGKNGEEVIRATSSSELVDVILRNTENPKELNDYIDNFHDKYSDQYLGKLDGNSAKRIYNQLLPD
jgi:hypothetical protein